MANDLDIVRSWWRRHSNGWTAAVDEHRDGSFTGGADAPPKWGDASRTEQRGRHRTSEAAMQAADREVADEGKHRGCDARCGTWFELMLRPKDPNEGGFE